MRSPWWFSFSLVVFAITPIYAVALVVLAITPIFAVALVVLTVTSIYRDILWRILENPRKGDYMI